MPVISTLALDNDVVLDLRAYAAKLDPKSKRSGVGRLDAYLVIRAAFAARRNQPPVHVSTLDGKGRSAIGARWREILSLEPDQRLN